MQVGAGCGQVRVPQLALDERQRDPRTAAFLDIGTAVRELSGMTLVSASLTHPQQRAGVATDRARGSRAQSRTPAFPLAIGSSRARDGQAVTASGAGCSLGRVSAGCVRTGAMSHKARSAPTRATAALTLSPAESRSATILVVARRSSLS